MFCKYCGNEMGDDAAFCSKCGKAVEENAVKDGEASSGNDGGTPVGEGNPAKKKAEDVAGVMEKTNPLCIAGIVLSLFSVILFLIFFYGTDFYFDIFGIVSLVGLVVSILGYCMARKKNQRGKVLAVVGMTACAVITLIWIF